MKDDDLIYRDGRVIMKIKRSEFVEDENGGHFIHTTREKDVTEYADRPDNLCKLCGFPAYPECMNTCSVGKFKDKEESRE